MSRVGHGGKAEPGFFKILGRCLRSKCPVCGQGRLFETFLPPERCEVCHFKFARQPGYYMGVLTPILPILAVITGIVFACVSYFGFHEELDSVLVSGGEGIAIGLVAFFRTAIAIYVALDHAIDPPAPPNP